jgi:hypothetical protein
MEDIIKNYDSFLYDDKLTTEENLFIVLNKVENDFNFGPCGRRTMFIKNLIQELKSDPLKYKEIIEKIKHKYPDDNKYISYNYYYNNKIVYQTYEDTTEPSYIIRRSLAFIIFWPLIPLVIISIPIKKFLLSSGIIKKERMYKYEQFRRFANNIMI